MSITQNRDLWLAERRKTIGSSDAYLIMGVAPFGKPDDLERRLWLSKMGMDADEDNDRLALGRHLEHGIAMASLEKIGGNIIEFQPFGIHLQEQWASATPDYIIQIGDRRAILEFKNTSKEPWEIVPEAYTIQTHWQGWVHGIDMAFIGALHGERGIRVYEVPLRLESKWFGNVVETCRGWFDRHVTRGEEPETVRQFAAAETIKSIRAESGKVAFLDELEFDVMELIEAQAKAKVLERDISALKDKIRAAMGDAEVGTVNGAVAVTYKNSGKSRTLLVKEKAFSHA